MMSVGIHSEPRSIVDRPDVQAAERERHAERDAEQQDRERPQDVEAARDDRVGPAAEVAGEQAEDHREQRS